jgi:hypothetical protein
LGISDDVKGLRQSLIRFHPCEPEIFESTHDIEMPLWWEREPPETRIDHCTGAMGAEKPVPQKELPALFHGFADPNTAAGTLIVNHCVQHRDRRMKRPVLRSRSQRLTIPAAVGKLLCPQPLDGRVDPIVPIPEGGGQ